MLGPSRFPDSFLGQQSKRWNCGNIWNTAFWWCSDKIKAPKVEVNLSHHPLPQISPQGQCPIGQVLALIILWGLCLSGCPNSIGHPRLAEGSCLLSKQRREQLLVCTSPASPMKGLVQEGSTLKLISETYPQNQPLG